MAKTPNPMMDFVVEKISANPNIDYRTLRDLAASRGYVVKGISYGRAKALLGLTEPKPPKVPKAPTVAAVSTPAAATVSATTVDAPGTVAAPVPPKKPRKATMAPITEGRGITEAIDSIQRLARERDAYRAALSRLVADGVAALDPANAIHTA